MANLKTICIDGNCMDNLHPVEYYQDEITLNLPSGDLTNIILDGFYVDKPCFVILTVRVKYSANANGSRMATIIRQDGSETTITGAIQRLPSAPTGDTYLTVTDAHEKASNSVTKFGARVFQNSGSTLTVSVLVAARVFETLI